MGMISAWGLSEDQNLWIYLSSHISQGRTELWNWNCRQQCCRKVALLVWTVKTIISPEDSYGKSNSIQKMEGNAWIYIISNWSIKVPKFLYMPWMNCIYFPVYLHRKIEASVLFLQCTFDASVHFNLWIFYLYVIFGKQRKTKLWLMTKC